MIRYITYYEGSFVAFRLWEEAKEYIEAHPGCRYQKVRSNKEEDAFRNKWKGKTPKRIYIAIHRNKVYRFNDWGTCKEFITTHEGSRYKGFTNEKEAQDFININVHRDFRSIIKDGTLLIFVGGAKKKWGFIAVKGNDTLTEKHGTIKVVPNEMEATLRGIVYAISQKEERVLVIYNDLGVEMLGNGSWIAHKKGTEEYVRKLSEMKKKINIDFLSISTISDDPDIIKIKERLLKLLADDEKKKDSA